MLSFYLCGINAVDLYNLKDYRSSQKRIEYNRSKTCGKRTDEAFTSINIISEAQPLLEKYVGNLSARYSRYTGLDTALCKGMKQLREMTGVEAPVTFYWARHSFATIARNKCGISKDDIAEALNHVDGEHRTTDIYIEKDWSIVDGVQSAVIEFIRKLDNPPTAVPEEITEEEFTNPDEQRRIMRVISA